jgi:catechol 2,3-dioxygenase-like lactoylglutathione lyase family enzyme
MVFSKLIPELCCKNLEKTLDFYKLLGFKVEYEREENRFAFISIDSAQFMFQELKEDDKWSVGELTYPFGNGINFQLEVDNINEIYKSLVDNDYKITFDIEENWYRQDNKLLGNKEFLIQDPDGYLLRISEDLGEKQIK